MKNARLRYYAIIVLGEFQIHFGIRKQKPSSLKEGFHKELLQNNYLLLDKWFYNPVFILRYYQVIITRCQF
jgi:hypothetical protein